MCSFTYWNFIQNLGSLLGDCVWSSKKREPETVTETEIETETETEMENKYPEMENKYQTKWKKWNYIRF